MPGQTTPEQGHGGALPAARPHRRTVTRRERAALRVDALGPLQGVFTGKDAGAAVAFALALADDAELRAFLTGWSEGDTREWPEFKPATRP